MEEEEYRRKRGKGEERSAINAGKKVPCVSEKNMRVSTCRRAMGSFFV